MSLTLLRFSGVFWGVNRSLFCYRLDTFAINFIKAIPHYWHRDSGFGGSSDVSNISCQISYVFIVGRSVKVWGLKGPQKTINVSIF